MKKKSKGKKWASKCSLDILIAVMRALPHSTESATTLIEQMAEVGMDFLGMTSESRILGVKDGSIDMINSALYYDVERPLGEYSPSLARLNEPQLQILETCPDTHLCTGALDGAGWPARGVQGSDRLSARLVLERRELRWERSASFCRRWNSKMTKTKDIKALVVLKCAKLLSLILGSGKCRLRLRKSIYWMETSLKKCQKLPGQARSIRDSEMMTIRVIIKEGQSVVATAIQRGKAASVEKRKAQYILSVVEIWGSGGVVSKSLGRSCRKNGVS